MLVKATKEKTEAFKEVLYATALDSAKSCYPLFSDGIKSRQDFDEHLEKGLTGGQDTSLFYMEGGDILGLIQYFVIPDDNYLQLCGFYVWQHAEAALDELLSFLSARYPGYEAYFGFSDQNKTAGALLQAHGFAPIEEDYHNTILLSEYHPLPLDENVRSIKADNFDDFRALHRAEEGEYWNNDRISANLDKWNIYAYYENEKAVAAIWETAGEIFGFAFPDEGFRADIFQKLVVVVLNGCKAGGQRGVTFFCGGQAQQALLSLGFRRVGIYRLYYNMLESVDL